MKQKRANKQVETHHFIVFKDLLSYTVFHPGKERIGYLNAAVANLADC